MLFTVLRLLGQMRDEGHEAANGFACRVWNPGNPIYGNNLSLCQSISLLGGRTQNSAHSGVGAMTWKNKE